MTCLSSQGLVNMGADSSRAHIILLHRCSVDRKWRGMRGLAGYFPDLGLHTTLTAESAGDSEALMITSVPGTGLPSSE